jgi:hypothetical protein
MLPYSIIANAINMEPRNATIAVVITPNSGGKTIPTNMPHANPASIDSIKAFFMSLSF